MPPEPNGRLWDHRGESALGLVIVVLAIVILVVVLMRVL